MSENTAGSFSITQVENDLYRATHSSRPQLSVTSNTPEVAVQILRAKLKLTKAEDLTHSVTITKPRSTTVNVGGGPESVLVAEVEALEGEVEALEGEPDEAEEPEEEAPLTPERALVISTQRLHEVIDLGLQEIKKLRTDKETDASSFRSVLPGSGTVDVETFHLPDAYEGPKRVENRYELKLVGYEVIQSGNGKGIYPLVIGPDGDGVFNTLSLVAILRSKFAKQLQEEHAHPTRAGQPYDQFLNRHVLQKIYEYDPRGIYVRSGWAGINITNPDEVLGRIDEVFPHYNPNELPFSVKLKINAN